jgi:predicted metalloprotease with PDZ domain
VIHYRVHIARPESHRIDVEVTFPSLEGHERIAIAAWTPGSYLVREFSRYLGELAATDAATGAPIELERLDKGTWRLPEGPTRAVRIRYDAFCHELTVRTPHVDDTHAFFTGTNVLVYAPDRINDRARIEVSAPTGWTVFCPLDSDGDAFLAPDWDTLADTPFECGPHPVLRFEACGVPHRIVLWGAERVRIDAERLCADFRRLVEQNAAIFGGLPYERYDFIVHITAEGRGGLEHLNSTVLATPWAYFEGEDGYRDLLGLVAHEHFHTWNVKRIRPAGLARFDYSGENYTRALWVSEGFTSYFDELVCRRAGLYTRQQYLDSLQKSLQRLADTPGRLRQSVEGASYDAWIRLYRPDADTPFRTVSYYLKGSIVALALDLRIRSATGGARSLDDVMRHLWADWRDGNIGFDERGVGDRVFEATGVELHDELHRWTTTTEEIDLAPLLAAHGVALTTEPAEHVDVGWTLKSGAGGPTVANVRPGSPAEAARIAPGDVLVAVAGRRCAGASEADLAKRLRAGEPVSVHTFRRDVLRESTLTPAPAAPAGRLKLAVVADAAPEAAELLRAWLGADEAPAPTA